MADKTPTDSANTGSIGGQVLARISELKPSPVGSAIFSLIPVRRRVVMENLRQVFGDHLGDMELRRLARCFYSHVAKTIFENFVMTVSSQRQIAGRVDVMGAEHVLKAAEQEKGVLILTGHFGNWELSAVAAMMQFGQYKNRFHVIRKSLAPVLEDLVFGRFRTAGLRVISPVNALNKVFDALDKNDVIIFIMDQHNVVGSKAIAVEFFGKEAGTNRSLALVARQHGSPVIPAISYRKPDGRHVMRFEPPLEWITAEHHRDEIYLNTLAYNRVLERYVLEHPDQWLWAHRRWKLDLRGPTRRRQRELKMGRR
jgi:KDO2-lipid IV(A) lauroyltransferase